MKVIDEDPIWRRNPPGSQFREELGVIVILSGDVMQLDLSELALELAHLLAVRRHKRALVGGFLHDLVDDQLQVTVNIESRSAELDGDA